MIRNLLGVSDLVAMACFALIGYASQWPYLRYCFESGNYFHGENRRCLIGRR
jgi:hypothetical protein